MRSCQLPWDEVAPQEAKNATPPVSLAAPLVLPVLLCAPSSVRPALAARRCPLIHCLAVSPWPGLCSCGDQCNNDAALQHDDRLVLFPKKIVSLFACCSQTTGGYVITSVSTKIGVQGTDANMILLKLFGIYTGITLFLIRLEAIANSFSRYKSSSFRPDRDHSPPHSPLWSAWPT